MPQERRAERRNEWNFVITDEGWSWAVIKPDGSEERCPNVYPTLKDAADDAMAHGFATWRQGERRRLDD